MNKIKALLNGHFLTVWRAINPLEAKSARNKNDYYNAMKYRMAVDLGGVIVEKYAAQVLSGFKYFGMGPTQSTNCSNANSLGPMNFDWPENLECRVWVFSDAELQELINAVKQGDYPHA